MYQQHSQRPGISLTPISISLLHQGTTALSRTGGVLPLTSLVLFLMYWQRQTPLVPACTKHIYVPLSFPPFHCTMIHQHAHSSVEGEKSLVNSQLLVEGECHLVAGWCRDDHKTACHCLLFKEALKKQIKQTDAFYQETKSDRPDKRPGEESKNSVAFLPFPQSLLSRSSESTACAK